MEVLFSTALPWQRSSAVASFLLIPLFLPHHLLTFHLSPYPSTSLHCNCLSHSVLLSPFVSREVQAGLLFTKACLVSISSSSLHTPPANLPTLPFFTTSSFLSLSPLIYLSRWAPTRSDALPLCLCCMCVIWIPYLPQWNSLVGLRPQWLHANLSLCRLSQGPGHQGLHFRKRALRGSVASWCGGYYHAPHTSCIHFPASLLFPHLKRLLLFFFSISPQLLVSSRFCHVVLILVHLKTSVICRPE